MVPRQSSEEIMKITCAGLETFLKNYLDANAFQEFLNEKNRLFHTWNFLWERLQIWLSQTCLTNIPDAIMNLLQMLPHAEPCKPYLQNSLAIHDSFWNQVFQNLVIAKTRL
ncbi:uncharacterized protein NPIL_18831 [Nephila pilipes]|uniref:Uncharacterized protein n=1 Tax=Nephila pilipes TaxID=299642 RepID=A0A8X6U3X1_NEPPI|nr:uncharacterized protein NPIL_18831 [Nephila pilipes]